MDTGNYLAGLVCKEVMQLLPNFLTMWGKKKQHKLAATLLNHCGNELENELQLLCWHLLSTSAGFLMVKYQISNYAVMCLSKFNRKYLFKSHFGLNINFPF